jgi:signal transduction histidine kinase
MKLIRKLTLVLVLGISLVLAAYGYVNVRREDELFQEQRREDVTQVGRAVAVAVASVWASEGEARALEVARRTSEQEKPLRIRWVWLDAPPGDAYHPDVEHPPLLDRDADADRGVAGRDRDGNERLYTYVPVKLRLARSGALEVSRTTARLRAHAARTLEELAAMTVVAACVSVLLAAFFGMWFVGRPMKALVLQARRIGASDLSARIAVRQSDELGELAHEMNVMCDRLDAAREHGEKETATRIAALEQLRHADRLVTVGRLAAGIAHELGTPLNVISGRAKMIASRELEGDLALESAAIVVTQADRMAAIIRQLLDFARSRAPQRTPGDLVALAREAVALLAPLARKRGVELVLRSAESPCAAEIDVGQIQQALANLVVNAIHASAPGGVVTVDAGRERARPPAEHGGPEGDYVRVSVVDGGAGIAPEDRDRIFEPFFTTKEVGEGTGLGLSVSYGIVREHGGWIAIESELGKGSRFSIFLPRGGPECGVS